MLQQPQDKISGRAPVTIVGAGPAGLACAIVLARAGVPVLVREWKEGVGHRFHDDFQGLENWSRAGDCLEELAALGIEPGFEHTATYLTTGFDSQGRAFDIRSERPLYYLLRRGPKAGSLDRSLLTQALEAGVEIRFNDRVKQTRGPSVLAAGPRRADMIAAGYLFETEHANGSWFSLDQKLAPGGYAYLLIQNGRGTLASFMSRGFGRQAFHVLRTATFFTETLGLKMLNTRKFGGFGCVTAAKSATRGGHPVIGEQAGFQDALAGFGLRYAMRSGALAARCLLEGRDYEREWRHEILPSIKTGLANRMIFETMNDRARDWALRGLAKANNDPARRLQRLYAPRGLTRLVYPIAALRKRKGQDQQSCGHQNCDCVWCRHRREEKRAATASVLALLHPDKQQTNARLRPHKERPKGSLKTDCRVCSATQNKPGEPAGAGADNDISTQERKVH
jgi:flavin-dependent dehydrogenase